MELYIYIYHEEWLSVRNAFGLCNSWHRETFYGTSLGPGEGRQGVDRTKGRSGLRIGVRVDLGETSPKP